MLLEPKIYKGSNLSKFRTFHKCDLFELSEKSQIANAFAWAKRKGRKVFVLGNGSNVFFKNKRIKSLIIKNALPPHIEYLGADKFRVSSSVELLNLLYKLFSEGRDAPYYLASAPCQVGGAIAMNAGTGIKESKYISDFLEEVYYWDNGEFKTTKKEDLILSHRNSSLGKNGIFIISAVFKFPPKIFYNNPIKERLEWAVKNQDLSMNNCGSLCTKYDAVIMKSVRRIFKNTPAGISPKKLNWAVNKSKNPIWLRAVIFALKVLHKIYGKELKFELKIVE